jgi:hypothetical protein
MLETIDRPHDAIGRAVLSDLAESESFFQVCLPPEVSQLLNGLTLQ